MTKEATDVLLTMVLVNQHAKLSTLLLKVSKYQLHHFLFLYGIKSYRVQNCYKGSSMRSAQLLKVRTTLSYYPSFSTTFHSLVDETLPACYI